MPRTVRKLSKDTRRAIRDRLQAYRRRRYQYDIEMARDAGVAHNTVGGWFHPDPSVPDTIALVNLARRKNLNLNWLLLGEGAELRGIEAQGDVWTQLRQALVAELTAEGIPGFLARRYVGSPRSLFRRNLEWLRQEMSVRRPRKGRATIGDAIGGVLVRLETLEEAD